MPDAGEPPDVRDGLTPTCRRALRVLHALRAQHGRYVQSVRVIDAVQAATGGGRRAAIYAELARMTHEWELRHPLVDGQGNFGSIDADPPAEPRYTELRLAPVGEALARGGNDDDSASRPAALPGPLPNLLVNGSFGVGAGDASRVPPHNLREVTAALLAYLDNPAIDVAGLMHHLPGPDFPTGATILHGDALHAAYETGRGELVVRGTTQVGRDTIHQTIYGASSVVWHGLADAGRAVFVTELPFGVMKDGRGGLLADIRRAVVERRVPDVLHAEDHSSERDGIRLAVSLRRDADPVAVIAALHAETRLETTIPMMLVAAVDGVGRTLSLRDLVAHYVAHRRRAIAAREPLLSAARIDGTLREELRELADRHGDERRTTLSSAAAA